MTEEQADRSDILLGTLAVALSGAIMGALIVGLIWWLSG